ncbi:MAG: hypothetical protein IJX53_06760 [Clostridia bacterium]|nr:hypothetical protein [Clostridia bacterium]
MPIFPIVKKHVDQLDRMGLLAIGAPPDEYDLESRRISEHITRQSTPDEIAQIMTDVFAKAFGETENQETYQTAAKRIYEDLHR